MKKLFTPALALLLAVLAVSLTATTGCGIYSFNEKGTVPDSIHTVRVRVDNRAPYINPQLKPNLENRVKQKIVSQTRLTSTTNDNADYDISAVINDYSVSTSGVTNTNGRQQSSINRLTVAVHIVLLNQTNNETKEYDVSRSFDFSANLSLQTAEANLLDEIIRNLSDEIFNRIFSDW
ncbi:MAG TPA: LPS assembly lipoprotein LptE [Flavisolibacter sp.]|jgi:hypothetical protein|nr:LPS assembly lipoprotein LptE [Flavisolibacter sp.]